ncbi:hypothetical protein [Salinithrix halophila]|uniref:Uncharacterized protein n=1 Tax=Salinithrix halophila TaxID=1485204 RepID=A0ABV8JIS8_9BACL
MRSIGKMKGRYYERFQVEDVLTFFSGQLVSAKSPDGTQVFLQEVSLTKPLPPGSKEILTRLKNEHLAPILDVMEEKDRVVLIHPPLGGEPLSLLIQPRQGMKPDRALNVYRQLLRTAVRLSELPLPLFTTLDPRNIIMEGDRPFVLFVSFEKFSKQQADEKWRFLLHFLLTGFRLEARPDKPEAEKSIRELPGPMKDLVIRAMDPKESMKSVLEAAEKVVPPPAQPVKKKRGVARRKILFPGVIAVIAIFGIVIGFQLFGEQGDAVADEEKAEALLAKPGGSARFDNVVFQREKPRIQSLPPSVQGSFRVTGELSQSSNKPFSISLVSENVESDFGFRLDDKGTIHLFQYVNGETFELAKSKGQLRIDPKKSYIIEIYYVPNSPFRVAVTEKGTNNKWVALGNVPMDSSFKVDLEGQQGTTFNKPGVSKFEKEEDVVNQWMGQYPWVLVDGSGVIRGKEFELDSNARVDLRKGEESFAFKRPTGYKEDPLKMELENADGSRYQFNWTKDGKMELVRLDYNTEQLGVDWVDGKWVPDQETKVSIVGTSQEFSVGIAQDALRNQVLTQPDKPVSIRNVSILSQSGLKLISE